MQIAWSLIRRSWPFWAGVFLVLVTLAPWHHPRTAQAVAGPLPAEFRITFRRDTYFPPIEYAAPALADSNAICSIPPGINWANLDSTSGATVDSEGAISGACDGSYSQLFFSQEGSATLTGTVDPVTGVLAFSYSGVFTQFNDTTMAQWVYTITDTNGIVFGTQGSGTATVSMNYTCTQPPPLPCGVTHQSYTATVQYLVTLVPIDCGAPVARRQASSCLVRDVSIDRIEVFQAIENEAGDTPLVKNKETFVRVFVKSAIPVDGVNVALTGLISTASLAGVPERIGGPAIAVASPERPNLGHSVDFKLPPEWTRRGALSLGAALILPQVITDPVVSNNTAGVELVFQSTSLPDVGHMKICYPVPTTCPGTFVEHAPLALNTLAPSSGGVYSVEVKAIWSPSGDDLSTLEGLSKFVASIKAVRRLMGNRAPDQLFFWLPNMNLAGGREGGSSNLSWGGSGHVGFGTAVDALKSQLIFAKYIAHNLGAGQPTEGSQNACSYAPGPKTAAWPYPTTRVNGWGLDQNAVITPTSDFWDITVPLGCPGERWISPRTTDALFARLTQGAGPQAPLAARASPAPAIYITGSAASAGDVGTLTSLLRVDGEPSTFDTSDPAGNHCLVFEDGALELERFCFTLSLADPETDAPLTEEWFSFATPFPEDTTNIRLVRDTTELAEKTLTANAPEVTIDSLLGQTWDGAESISWTGNDADGDALLYTVLYSNDAGASWLPMLTDSPQTTFAFDSLRLAPADDARIRVFASDGLRTTEATSDAFIIQGALGDVTCDDLVEAEDVLQLLRTLVGLTSSPCASAGDINCDTTRDIVDVLGIRRHVASLGVTQQQPCRYPGNR